MNSRIPEFQKESQYPQLGQGDSLAEPATSKPIQDRKDIKDIKEMKVNKVPLTVTSDCGKSVSEEESEFDRVFPQLRGEKR